MAFLPFWDHVDELRKALLRCGWTILLATLLAFCFYKQLFSFFITPLSTEKFYFLSPLEGFAAAAKISFWTGITLSSPLWLSFALSFFLPALKLRERRLLLLFFFLSFVFVCVGILFAYTITLPLVMKFFYNFNADLGENHWSLVKSLDLIISLVLAHGIVFELYVLLLFLIRCGFVSYTLLKKTRKGIIVAIFVLAAFLTPPDVLSQLLLAFPMLLLFESSLLYARLLAKKK